MDDVDPALLAANLRTRTAQSLEPIRVFWMKVSSDRDSYAGALRAASKPNSAAVIVVRRAVFTDPNSVMADLAELLAENELECRGALEASEDGQSLTVVLLGRSRLSVPQISSPVVVPRWVPDVGGQLISVTIHDLTSTVAAPMDAPEVCTNELAEALFRLEGLLVARMGLALSDDKQIADVFSGQFGRDGDASLPSLLESMAEHRKSVQYAGAYRPSRRTAQSLTARLWSAGQDRNSEDSGPGKALARCLGLTEAVCPLTPSFLYVLRRPTNQPKPWEAACRDLIVTVATTCQLITAAAHADVYPLFPVSLLDAVSRELRTSMSSWERFLASLA